VYAETRYHKKHLNYLIKRATAAYYARLSDSGRSHVISKMIMEIVDACKNGKLMPDVAKCVSKYIRHRLPEEWVTEDLWSLLGFEDWLKRTVDQRGGLHGERPRVQRVVEAMGCTRSVALWRDARVLAKICVHCLRIMQVSAEAALIALLEYRRARPRK